MKSMKLEWYLTKDEYDKVMSRLNEKEVDDRNDIEEHVGCVRFGDLCYDIMTCGKSLWFDLYVGGVDSGYGCSYEDGYENYPYDFCAEASFNWEDLSLSYNQFVNELTSYIKEHIEVIEGYVVDGKSVDLVAKANEELKLW